MRGIHSFRALLAVLLVTCIATSTRAGLMQTSQFSGNIALEIVGTGTGNPPTGIPATGSLALSNVVPGVPLRATFYANTVNTSGQQLDLSLNGMSPVMPLVIPFANDQATSLATLFAYQWDVSNIVAATGAGTYNFTVGSNGNGNQISGVALAVVYNDPSAPSTQITFIEGMQAVADSGVAETESVTFTGLNAGPTQISIFTVADDNTGTGEQIRYNSNLIGQNIDQNLGLNASLLQLNTTSVSGNNILSIQSSSGPGLQTDTFGWMLGIASVQQSATIVPEPSTFALLAMGALATAGYGWRLNRKKRRAAQKQFQN